MNAEKRSEKTEPPSDGSTPGPSGLTITEAMSSAERDGYTTQFHVVDDGEVRCDAGEHLVNPASLHVGALWRIEGASDAADMTLVMAVQCPRCDAQGTLTVGYGPNASAADERVQRDLVITDTVERAD